MNKKELQAIVEAAAKKIKAEDGPFELDTPRDRVSSFEPQLVKKHQRRFISMDDKTLLLLRQRDDDSRSVQDSYKEFRFLQNLTRISFCSRVNRFPVRPDVLIV